MHFVHETLGQRVAFATGAAAGAVGREIERLGASRVMVIARVADAELAGRVTSQTPVAAMHHEVVMHVPVAAAERARAVAGECGADALVSIGGGSATGLAKAVALTTGLPIVAVPTTFAGSEATDVWGLTENRTKTTGNDARVLPRSVVYDATLTVGLPAEIKAASGLNALAHAVDSLWAPRADPINATLAGEGARALAAGLGRIAEDAGDLSGLEQTLYGTYLSSVAFASAGSGLHHKICHVLGGRYDLPHAQTHAVVLPHVLALNAPNAPDAEERLRAAFSSDTALAGLRRLRSGLDVPSALREIGLDESALDEAAAHILPVVPDSNPTAVTAENLGELLRAAWEGATP